MKVTTGLRAEVCGTKENKGDIFKAKNGLKDLVLRSPVPVPNGETIEKRER